MTPLAVGAAVLGIGACGGDDDFPNEPRPPASIEVTANITESDVVVSPREFGAGPVTITAANQSEDPATLTFDGPTQIAGTEIPPNGVGDLKAVFEEGEYEITGGEGSSANPGTVTVGPERDSSQNELLLP